MELVDLAMDIIQISGFKVKIGKLVWFRNSSVENLSKYIKDFRIKMILEFSFMMHYWIASESTSPYTWFKSIYMYESISRVVGFHVEHKKQIKNCWAQV